MMKIDSRFFRGSKPSFTSLLLGILAVQPDGRSGRLTAQELAKTVANYGPRLSEFTEQALLFADTYAIDRKHDEWDIDLPLWTGEEG